MHLLITDFRFNHGVYNRNFRFNHFIYKILKKSQMHCAYC